MSNRLEISVEEGTHVLHIISSTDESASHYDVPIEWHDELYTYVDTDDAFDFHCGIQSGVLRFHLLPLARIAHFSLIVAIHRRGCWTLSMTRTTMPSTFVLAVEVRIYSLQCNVFEFRR
ncbi:hypothetical protein Droror1_Dr00019657 [Drosera rotundifolia]